MVLEQARELGESSASAFGDALLVIKHTESHPPNEESERPHPEPWANP
jgi:hypothetical protein